MIAGCPVPATGGAFLSGLLGHIDCQAQNIGAGGYQALAAPGSPLSLVLTGLLTLFVALFGIRMMMMGHAPEVRDGVLGVVKIGLVLLLATSWPAYRTIAYDVVLRGPAELAGAIGQPAGLPGASGGLVARLQNADNMIVALTQYGTGGGLLAPPQPGDEATPLPPPGLIADGFALGAGRVAYLVGTIGALAIVRLAAGLLLALAPLFAGLLLFEGTRALFMGWLRGLIAAALGALGVAVVLGVELALLEPWLIDTLNQRAARLATPAAPVELLVLTLAFTITLFAIIAAAARVAFAVHAPGSWRVSSVQMIDRLRGGAAPAVSVPLVRHGPPEPAPSRAFAVADAVATMQHREAAAAANNPPRSASAALTRDSAAPAVAPLGQSFRRTRTRVSSGAQRRDRIS